jgi:disulfide oxidoreductase YuzD
MEEIMRKKRSDRNHIIYKLINSITGNEYIGLTVQRNQKIIGSVKIRFKQHISRSINEDKDWLLYQEMREYGWENFSYQVLEIVRGKKETHKREVELINLYKPQLNTKKII